MRCRWAQRGSSGKPSLLTHCSNVFARWRVARFTSRVHSDPQRITCHAGMVFYGITPREREIVESVCRGMKNKEIAEALSITPGTVKVHLMHIFEKTGVRDRFQLALQGRQFLSSTEEELALRKTLEA